MAFSTLRGRPRQPAIQTDSGTPELRLKHALRLTAEPIDLCLEKRFITVEQHWSGLHLRWLYTVRYGAPSLTTIYADRDAPARPPAAESDDWRILREREYHEAAHLLKQSSRYQCVMGLAVFNERPAFLSPKLVARAAQHPALATELERSLTRLREGLDLLAYHWRHRPGG